MTVRLVRADAARRVPWRNGLGTTLELASDAPAHEPDRWSWRLSIADVPAAAPFSRFPGVDRRIARLAGAGMRLEIDGAVHEVPSSGPALSFSGDDAAHGAPDGAGVRDVNLMTRRDAWDGRMRVERLGREEGAELGASGAVVLVHAFVGTLVARTGDAPAIALDEGDTLVAAGACTMRPCAGAVVVIAELLRRS